MTQWLILFALIGIAASFASTLAIWAWGRFAHRAQGVPSFALPVKEDQTELDRRIAPLTSARPGESGLALLRSNTDAFAARALAARRAGRSLDLMYYIWNDDITGRLLLAELLAAARRGVRIRLLLDDIGVSAHDDMLLALNDQPGIEVRLFNPTRVRKGDLRRGIEMAFRFASVNRRMHNKAWIADSRLAIVGGRNIGDAYFDAAESTNFCDLDLIAFGAVAQETVTMFDSYWNSGIALPVRAISEDSLPEAASRERLAKFMTPGNSDEARPYVMHLRTHSVAIIPGTSELHWTGKARLLADPPEKALGKKGQNWVMHSLFPVLVAAKQRITITSPYFVPGETGTSQLTAIASRGVTLDILTNSLAATDVAAVHGGYARWRRPLLKAGIGIYELRPTTKRRMSFRGSNSASLHTKAVTADGLSGFIGSLNFDPRSVSLNTEMGVLFDQPDLVSRMDRIFQDEISADSSWCLRLDAKDRLQWYDESNLPVKGKEPMAGPWRRGLAWLVGRLPLDSQL